jgi:AcrR family transcriptional regulator
MVAISETSGKAARRREILDAAYAEFATRGYAGASMAAIAQRAQASKETLYAWFGNKETLFSTLLTEQLEGMTGRVTAAATEDMSPQHVLPVVAEDLMRLLLAIAPLSRALAPGDPGDKATRLIAETILSERRRFADYILHCRDQGEIDFDDDPLELASLFVAMAQGEWEMRLGMGMLDRLTDAMIAEHARRVTRIFLRGLAPAKGASSNPG